MPLTIIGTVILVAVNLCLAIWALLKEPRTPAYRTFAFFAISVVTWALGYEVFLHQGAPDIWHRLSFLGLSLAPANLLCLALAARAMGSSPRPDAPAGRTGGYWQFLLYVPALAAGLALSPTAIVPNTLSPSWHVGFYVLSAGETLIFAGVTTAYLAAALWISWRAARTAAEGGDWPLYLVQLPFVAGTFCVLAVAYLRREKSPTVSLWAMIMSEYAMYAMIRNGYVRFELNLKRGVPLALSSVVLAACVALGIAFFGFLFGRTLSVEMSLVLVVSIVALCVLYAAILPRLEEFFDSLFHRRRNP
jgi:uncharacterized membrane protein